MPTSGLFSRNLKKTFPIASRGEGCWIIDESGRRFLDAAGQAAVVSIGHGVAEVGQAMAEQAAQIAFAICAACSANACPTSATPWPILTTAAWPAASRKRRPLSSIIQQPSPRDAMGNVFLRFREKSPLVGMICPTKDCSRLVTFSRLHHGCHPERSE